MFSLSPPRVKVGEKSISLDSSGVCSFISHAHSDHALVTKNSTSSIIASVETIELMKARKYPVKGKLEIPEKVTLANAGHILGARQLVAETSGGIFAYTGDFRLSDSFCVKGAEVPQCDVLLMEATFGSPEYVFPPREQVAQEISKWVLKEREKGIVLLGGYSLGKAQELVKILNDYAGITPLAEESVCKINEVYMKHGVNLDFIKTNSPEGEEELKKNFVAVVPMHKVSAGLGFQLGKAHSKRVSSAVATGWASTEKFGLTRAFCLSDHSDFPELLDFVERTGAKKVFTHYGHSKKLARELRSRGVNARGLDEQQTLLVSWEE